MRRFLENWGLQSLLVIVGLIILYGMFLAPAREEAPTNKKKGAAATAKK